MSDLTRPTITSVDHAYEVRDRIVSSVYALVRQWAVEDADACAPTGGMPTAGGGRGGGTSDPTSTMMELNHRYRDRDRIGSRLARVEAEVSALVDDTARR